MCPAADLHIDLRGRESLRRELMRLQDRYGRQLELRVGVLEGATNSDGRLIAEYAVKNEFGSRADNTPPRPFMRWTVRRYSRDWADGLALLLRQNTHPRRALELLGEMAGGMIRRTIIDWRTPPNSAETQARKGFDNPLIENRDMLNSIDSEVTP